MITPSPLNPTGASARQHEDSAIVAAQQTLATFGPLLENKDFLKFWGVFAQAVKDEGAKGLDLSLSPGERNEAVHRYNALKKWHDWPMIKKEAAEARLKAETERTKAAATAPRPAP